MSEQNPIRVFVTHGFSESENYLRIFEFLESVDRFYYINVSRPDASVEGGMDSIRDELIAQVKLAEAIFVLPDLFEKQPDLVNFLMDAADANKIPMIVIRPFGQVSETPPELIARAKEHTLEERFIKRYLLLDGKTKTRWQLLGFIKSLQRAIAEKKIRKASKHAGIIIDIQNNLVSTYNALSEKAESIKFTLVPKKAEELKKLVGNKRVRLSVTYIKRFVNLYGKETVEKAQRLLDLMAKATGNGKIPKNDPYFEQAKTVEKALKRYIDKRDIKISDAELRGLAGVAGTPVPDNGMGNPFEGSEVVSSLDLQKAVFRHMGFTGIWKRIIGDPEEPFHVMVYGPGGKGKSTFSIKFATYLSKGLMRNVLYIADEEKVSGKLKDKLQLFNAYNQNLSVTGKMPRSFKGYEAVFLDSVTSMGMEPEELEEIQEQYPNTCFIYILQTNKQGSFYGKKKWEHLCDVVLRFEDGVVNVEKNRFGNIGEHRVR